MHEATPLNRFFEGVADDAGALVLEMLGRRTVADSVAEIRKLEKTRLDRVGTATERTLAGVTL